MAGNGGICVLKLCWRGVEDEQGAEAVAFEEEVGGLGGDVVAREKGEGAKLEHFFGNFVS